MSPSGSPLNGQPGDGVVVKDCPRCKGSGMDPQKDECTRCGGFGQLVDQKALPKVEME